MLAELAAENARLKLQTTKLLDETTEPVQTTIVTPAQAASPSFTTLNRQAPIMPKKDVFRWAKLSDLGALQEEDSTDDLVSGDASDSDDSIADALEAMNKLLVLDGQDSPIEENGNGLSFPDSAESSFSASLLSGVTTEDLTGFVVKDSEYPAHGGGYADVYTGTLSKEGKKTKRLRREIRLWSCLHHPNVVPLLGTTMSFGSHTSMVCPWMNEGSLHHYLTDRKSELNLRRRLQILSDVVEGLSYLHSQPVIHGDLTTGNILMDGGKAHLSDFGLSNVMAEARINSFLSSTVGGAPRWTAPELLHVGTDPIAPADMTKKCDIYSFGSVALQVISGRIPYEDIVSEVQVIMQLIKGINPPRPAEPLLSDAFWEFIVLCWSRDPFKRPEIDQVREKLQLLRYSCTEETLASNIVDCDKQPEQETNDNE
ncbi:putative serine/threonine-protein kinase [Psilocybe cubensis]|uniref:Serine/threonine-protein kinase n=1 Tax=Psilocybe cubensis TaxID=181762 RepID=A0ACB8GIH4_PSICU|nr:putative serine/threonine-protein kinase [Psilocybe cubensis]KAH9475510.1 putative serine/threonine-protein kinase [Psilocybe cubensis]